MKAESPRAGAEEHSHGHGHGHGHSHRHDRDRPVAEELQELKDRLADLTGAVDELLRRQQAQQPPAPPEG